MKRLVFCFDGTWNKLDAQHPTNVVITAESVLPLSIDKSTAQLIYYDEGVGTSAIDRIRGGVFGHGLMQNLAEAYRFLIFNYSSGDEIYIFGFSRGAYTARSFAGLLSNCGVLLRKNADMVSTAIANYQSRDRSPSYVEKMLGFRKVYSPKVCVSDADVKWRGLSAHNLQENDTVMLAVKYLGVWDTVGALGIPATAQALNFLNAKYKFHDTDLSPFVKSARHAVAIDERRKDFAPTLWTNLQELNKLVGHDGELKTAPYQQMWFPGTHGSVGGGGERRGLSDAALSWVLDGARKVGLEMDTSIDSRIFELKPDHKEHCLNSEKNGVLYSVMNKLAARDRTLDLVSLDNLSVSTNRRWSEKADDLFDKKIYRPGTLKTLEVELNNFALQYKNDTTAASLETKSGFRLYEVKKGDALRAIAKAELGNPNRAEEIFRLNLDQIDDIDRIYIGSILKLPKS